MSYERRYFANEFEVRSVANGKSVIEGHAAVFNKRSQNLGGFVEEIEVGSFDATVRDDDIRALFNHDPSLILGRNRAGTLEMTPDSSGLAYRIHTPDTQYARDLLISMERGDISQSSFGFGVPSGGDTWSYDESNTPVRSLNTVRLSDISPVTFPAYLDADSAVAKRSLATFLESDESRTALGAYASTLALTLEQRLRTLAG